MSLQRKSKEMDEENVNPHHIFVEAITHDLNDNAGSSSTDDESANVPSAKASTSDGSASIENSQLQEYSQQFIERTQNSRSTNSIASTSTHPHYEEFRVEVTDEDNRNEVSVFTYSNPRKRHCYQDTKKKMARLLVDYITIPIERDIRINKKKKKTINVTARYPVSGWNRFVRGKKNPVPFDPTKDPDFVYEKASHWPTLTDSMKKKFSNSSYRKKVSELAESKKDIRLSRRRRSRRNSRLKRKRFYQYLMLIMRGMNFVSTKWAVPKREKKYAKCTSVLCSQDSANLRISKEGFDCPICLADAKELDGVSLRNCGHDICRACLEGYLKHSIHNISCPTPDCNVLIQKRERCELVPDPIPNWYEKYIQSWLQPLGRGIVKVWSESLIFMGCYGCVVRYKFCHLIVL